ncbi:MAG: SusC/RagA family TonB-linked outer membrane protein [Lewinellaceae bacterium]|jgi:TonB-linked SusC/RagA family outer membrane protein|nr:SusC/RagA family TonB-linked outer membrane protein [Lewinellaceae bacterium]
MKFLHTFTKGGMLAVFLLLLGNFALAQRTVTGKVTDAENGEALIGATVSVVGTTRGAVTDIDGNYSVEVPEGSTQLRFAYTGYAEEVVPLGASNSVDIAMKPGSVLDEVVVVGYGTVKSKEVTSAVASLKPKDFNKGNISDPAQLLQGKIAGVTISRPGSDPNGEFTIRLRGLSSLSSGVSPLIVVDGIPGVNLNLIDPNDIESIDVLKDGSAAAIYGTRASAGVVLITTKKGSAGRTTATYNGFVAFDQVSRRYKTLDASTFVALGGNDLSPEDGPGDTNTDWFDEVTTTGKSNVHNLSLAGGIANGSYRVSFNYRNVEGILRESGFKQYNSSLSFTQKVLNNRLTIDGGLLITSRNQTFGFLDAFRYAIVANPTAKITDPGNSEYTRYGGYVEKDLFDYFNPVAIIEQNQQNAKGNRLMGNARATYQVIPNLTATLSLAQERFNYDYGEFYSKQSKWRGIGRNGLGIQGTNFYVSNLLEATSEYTVKFQETSNLKILGGYSWQQFDYNGLQATAGNIISNEFANNNLGAFLDFGRGLGTVSSYKGRNRLIAFFGRASLNINDTYFGSLGVRREGSSRFGPDNRWGVFPFVSGGVNLEKLLSLNNVEQLKLRAGYGVTGNQPNQNSLYREVYSQGPLFYYNGNYVPSFGPTQNANPGLKWEEKGEFNVGLDFAFFNYKLTGSLDYYNRLTKDLIIALAVPVPPNFAPTTFDNVASIRNKGFEALLNYANLVETENFTWSPGIVFSKYSITLEDFGRADTLAIAEVGAPGQNGVYYTIAYNNAPLGQLWGPVRTGVNDDGSIAYEDINGDGNLDIDAFNLDQQKIGNGVPSFELGFNNTVTLGNFELNFFLRGVFGHDLANEYRVFYENLDPTAATWNKVDTKYFDESATGKNRFNSTHIEKATFLRLDNASLGYNFKLPTDSWFTNARVYLSGQNLFTITGYTGVDPEPRLGDTGASDNGGRFSTALNPLAPGIDRRSTYFLARTYSFGVNFGF